MRIRKVAIALVALSFGGCASSQKTTAPNVDLSEARKAVEEARAAGAEKSAAPSFSLAEKHLKEAETELSQGNKDSAQRAEWLGRLALEGARCALALSQSSPPPVGSTDSRPLQEKLDQAQANLRRLDQRVGTLQLERDILRREMLRMQARLKGTATMEEASSAIAEARILLRRLPQEKSPALSRILDLVGRSEGLLRAEDFGSALSDALQAQDEAFQLLEGRGQPEEPPLKKAYSVNSNGANLRAGPGTDDPIVETLKKGTAVEALAARGEWIQVRAGALTGWIHRSLLE